MLEQCQDSKDFSTAFAQALAYARTAEVTRQVEQGKATPEVDIISLVSSLTGVSAAVIGEMRDGLAFRHRDKIRLVVAAVLPLVVDLKASIRLQNATNAMLSPTIEPVPRRMPAGTVYGRA